jgi:hypothetical protein
MCVASYGFIGDVDTWVSSGTAVSAVEMQLESHMPATYELGTVSPDVEILKTWHWK